MAPPDAPAHARGQHASTSRAIPGWGRRVARLPNRGILIVATDLQGNWNDYQALKEIFMREKADGHEPWLLLCGDLIHGPGDDLSNPRDWPEYLGSFYLDRSAELILDFEAFTREEQAIALLGNHEHAHVGGPVVSKFHPDEAAVLDHRLGTDRDRIHAFLRSFPLLAVAPCGAVFCHGAPGASEADLDAFESIEYGGYEKQRIDEMLVRGTLGGLLWTRGATPEQARALLRATQDGDTPRTFCVFGHDVVREGFLVRGDEQLCLSTSFGCYNRDKHYLRLDLGENYPSARALRPGIELRRLYPHAR